MTDGDDLFPVLFELPLSERGQSDGVSAPGAERGFFVTDFVASRPNVQSASGWLSFDALSAGIALEGFAFGFGAFGWLWAGRIATGHASTSDQECT